MITHHAPFIFVGSLLILAAAASAPAQSHNAEERGIRGVWLHPGVFGTEREAALPRMEALLDEYVGARIDTLVVLVKTTSGEVYYRSHLATPAPGFDYDFLEAILARARERGMTVHPWFCVFTEHGLHGQVREHPEWLIRNKDSEMLGIVNPALPEVRQYEISLMVEVVKLYSLDWVHLDYIRYPSSPREAYFSFDPQTRQLFKEHSGVDPLDIKATDSGNMLWNEWIEWNSSRVTQFLESLTKTP
ncbi:MAG: family 10 glycosylhydrolase [Planctomycetota bacterium]